MKGLLLVFIIAITLAIPPAISETLRLQGFAPPFVNVSQSSSDLSISGNESFLLIMKLKKAKNSGRFPASENEEESYVITKYKN
ncbi:MAG: hypothetical protein WCG27_04610, partial [Pseudomonadota bacterium]